MDRPLGAVEAPQLLLLSAPFSACRAPPHDCAARESSSVLPVEYSSLSREFRAAGVREPAAHPVTAAGWATSAPCTPLPSGVGEIQAAAARRRAPTTRQTAADRPPSAAGVALVHLLEDQLQLELMADESSPLGSAGERHMAAA
eukprot:CAMPEP_0185489890 /NCGR_PEP_ID=MMETSP1366-20130426/13522_1 /TAXON_ID=38817 /ORGANISM="Gephyrocapsa oceanica, Strain RCC1303" /LENGTH=143 /DNA_ID=CAMNT_0028098511 /DNA_START=184 /DNA_END=609 /DNA_ORIENTATION=+